MRDPDDVGIRAVAAVVAVAAALMLTSCAENEPESAVTLSPHQSVPPFDNANALSTEPVQPTPTAVVDVADQPPGSSTTVTEPGVEEGLVEIDDLADPDTLDEFEVDTEVVIGRSVEDRPITAVRRGSPGGTKVLVVGVIHGDEDAGADIVDVLRLADVPDGVELWLVRSMNPDGQAHQERHNADGVDLNRNFAHNWGPVAEPGNWEYAGPGPASEPETQVMTDLGQAVRPDLVLWYHQDLFRISPSTGRDGQIRTRYAGLTGLPVVTVSGGTYTGTASQWSRTVVEPGGVGFTIELGSTLSRDDAIRHAEAVLTVASEM